MNPFSLGLYVKEGQTAKYQCLFAIKESDAPHSIYQSIICPPVGRIAEQVGSNDPSCLYRCAGDSGSRQRRFSLNLQPRWSTLFLHTELIREAHDGLNSGAPCRKPAPLQQDAHMYKKTPRNPCATRPNHSVGLYAPVLIASREGRNSGQLHSLLLQNNA